MKEFIEYGAGVFKITVKPDEPGIIPRTMRIEQASGKPFTSAEWRRVAGILVRAMKMSGVKVNRVRIGSRKKK